MSIIIGSKPEIETWINVKTKGRYTIVSEAIDATNSRNEELVIVYRDVLTDNMYVRQKEEFFLKFKKGD